MTKLQQFDTSPISVTIYKAREVAWLRALVSFGTYETLDDAVADLVEDARVRHNGILLHVDEQVAL